MKLVDDFRLFPTSYLRDELRLSWLKPWQEQNLPSMLGSLSGTGWLGMVGMRSLDTRWMMVMMVMIMTTDDDLRFSWCYCNLIMTAENSRDGWQPLFFFIFKVSDIPVEHVLSFSQEVKGWNHFEVGHLSNEGKENTGEPCEACDHWKLDGSGFGSQNVSRLQSPMCNVLYL